MVRSQVPVLRKVSMRVNIKWIDKSGKPQTSIVEWPADKKQQDEFLAARGVSWQQIVSVEAEPANEDGKFQSKAHISLSQSAPAAIEPVPNVVNLPKKVSSNLIVAASLLSLIQL